jgi:hypothetical protein
MFGGIGDSARRRCAASTHSFAASRRKRRERSELISVTEWAQRDKERVSSEVLLLPSAAPCFVPGANVY